MSNNLIGIKTNRNNGYIYLDDFLSSMSIDTTSIDRIITSGKVGLVNEKCSSKVFYFYYNGIKYYFKTNELRKPFNYYAELLAEELLKDYGLPCAEYDLAMVSNNIGVISKDFTKEGSIYIDLKSVIMECYGEDKFFDYLHLEGIWNAFEIRYKKESIVSKLMDRIIDKYIFDILTNQLDSTNLKIVEEEDNIDIAPIYDNELMLYSTNYFSMGVDEKVDNYDKDGISETLDKFIKYSSSDYYNKIIDKLWIISEDNLLQKFANIENKTNWPIPDDIKNSFLQKFKIHRKKIEYILSQNNKRSHSK